MAAGTQHERTKRPWWERAERGQHTVLIGIEPGQPPSPLRVIAVRCDGPATTSGPLEEARRRAEDLAASRADVPLWEEAQRRVVTGLRRHLLGDLRNAGAAGSLVEALNRFANLDDRPSALVLTWIDGVDGPTSDALRQMVERPGWLRLPLILVFRRAPDRPAMTALRDAVIDRCGSEAQIVAEADPPAPSPAAKAAAPPAWSTVAPEVLRVLRAAAVAGPGFESHLVAQVLDLDPIEVLDALQRAADAGVAIEDHGDDRFHFGDEVQDGLRASTLPSFARAMHKRYAALFAEQEEVTDRGPSGAPNEHERSLAFADPPGEEGSEDDDARDEDANEEGLEAPAALGDRAPIAEVAPSPWEVLDAPPPVSAPAVTADPAEPAPASPPPADDTGSGMRHGAAPARESDLEAAARELREAARALPDDRGEPPQNHGALRAPADRKRPSSPGNEARAAQHLAEAGEWDAAAARYMEAAERAAGVGAYGQAVAHAERAVALLDRLPATPARRQTRVEILLDLGRLLWHAAGPTASFTLRGALTVLDAAVAALDPKDPPDLVADAASLGAGVRYDIGDPESLDRAMNDLTATSRALHASGASRSAARLLNDQAAIFVRMGDPVRAAHLLDQSRKVFEPIAKADPIAAIEMAETDHLFARIPLHVASRPGREDDALSLGLDYALAAERAFRKVGAPREVARVHESAGRLWLRRHKPERASESLQRALQIQQSIGDIVGLARSTSALAELLNAEDRPEEALAALSESILFNTEKGSPIGIAYNRQMLGVIAARLANRPGGQVLIGRAQDRILAAERALGRLALP